MPVTEVISYVVLALGLISAIVSTIQSIIIKVKGKKEKKQVVTLGTYLDLIKDEIPKLMQAVESVLKDGNGAYKKADVMSKVRAICVEKGVPFKEEYVDQAIENYVAMSKTINVGKE